MSGQLPLVSIITVVLNDKAGLDRTMKSVQGQTYSNIQYIVVDGGSTDGTREILQAHSDVINKWISEPDRGIGDAFNKGIALAEGGIIGILNAGDCYCADTVETIVQHYQQHSNRESFFCSGNMRVHEWDTVLKADPDYGRRIHFMMPMINHPTCFVASEVYRWVGGFNPDIAIAMDYEFLKRCHKAGIPILCIDKTLVEIDSYGLSDKRFGKACRELLTYSDNKFLTLLLIPLMMFNRLRMKRKQRKNRIATSTAAR